jgi:hypothetical protein
VMVSVVLAMLFDVIAVSVLTVAYKSVEMLVLTAFSRRNLTVDKSHGLSY